MKGPGETVCPACHHETLDIKPGLLLGDRRKGLQGNWQLGECVNCGTISMVLMPDDDELKGYYEAYAKNQDVELAQRRGSRHPELRKLYHSLSGDLDPRDFIEVPDHARVLDYGCGLAGYLSDFHSRGIAISGAEIAGYVVEACQRAGFDVRGVDDLSRIPFPDEEFDIVYLMQVFEHLRDPHGFLDELYRVLKPDGVLYLAVPNAASFWRRVFGQNWVSGWYAPFHLFHYTRSSLARLTQLHGFELSDAWTNTPESWFRLNLKAVFYPGENYLDWRRTWLDWRVIRFPVMMALRLFELPIKERDCLVVKLQKKGGK